MAKTLSLSQRINIPSPTVLTSDKKLTASEALEILNHMSCTVILNICIGEYTTRPYATYEMVYVEELQEYTHIHNIQSIKIIDTTTYPDPCIVFMDIDWHSEDDHPKGV